MSKLEYLGLGLVCLILGYLLVRQGNRERRTKKAHWDWFQIRGKQAVAIGCWNAAIGILIMAIGLAILGYVFVSTFLVVEVKS
jgi:hypothetical protein